MTNPVAKSTDVTDRIDTDLSGSEIDTFLEDAVFDLEEEYDLSSQDSDWRVQVEWRLAVYKIVTIRERDTQREQTADVTITWDESRIERLRQEILSLTDDQFPLGDEPIEADFEVF